MATHSGPPANAAQLVLRSVHDLGLASWFGGSLMGITGLRGAAYYGTDPVAQKTDREANGWSAWSPVAAVSIAAHLTGAAGLVVAEWQSRSGRPRRHRAIRTTSVVRVGLTAAAMTTTGLQGVVGRRLLEAEQQAQAGEADAQRRAAKLRVRARILDAATPVLTGALVVAVVQEHQRRQAPALAALGSALVAGIAGAADEAARLAGTAKEAAQEAVQDVVGSVRDTWSSAAPDLPGGVDAAKETVEAAREVAGSLPHTVADKLPGKVADTLPDGLADQLSDRVGEMVETVAGGLDTVRHALHA